MGKAFWWICVVIGPLWITRSGLLPRGTIKLFYACIGYAALVSSIAWLAWGFELFSSVLVTWAVTVVGATATCLVFRHVLDTKPLDP